MSELVTGSLNSVVFWEEKSLSKRRSAQPFPDSDYHVASLSWSSNNSKLAVIPKWGDRVAVCDFRDDILTWSYLTHKDGGAFTCGCLLGNSRYLVSGCGNSSILIWDLKHKNVIKTFQGHSSAITSVAVTSNDHYIASGNKDGHIFLYPLSSSSKQKQVQLTGEQTNNQLINRLCLSLTEQSHLGCVSESGDVSLWSIESQRRLTTFSQKHTGAATDLSFTPSNKILMVSVGMDACIRCYDLQTRKVVATISAPSALNSVTILRDGLTLLAGGTDGRLYLYELRSLKTPKSIIEGHQSAVTCITPQYSFKTPGKRSSARGSQRKGQLSPDVSLLQSSEKSPPKGQRSSTQPGQDNKSHQQTAPPPVDFDSIGRKTQIPQSLAQGRILPETVTPFVTQRPGLFPESNLEPQTPYSRATGLKSDDWVRGSAPLVSVLATPANDHGDMSSIFSPLDQQGLVTPSFSAGKVTATVPPTMRGPGLEITTPSTRQLTSSTTLVQTSSILQAPLPTAVPLTTPQTGLTNRSAHLAGSNSGAGIFSPLDSGGYRHGDSHIGQSPLLDSPLVSASGASHMTSLNTICTDVPASHASHVTDGNTRLPDLQEESSTLSAEPPSTKSVNNSSHQTIEQKPDRSFQNISVATDDGGKSPTSPPLLAGGGAIQTQYLEGVIKESMEELWYSVHRDNRGLTVDVIKHFLTLQEGLVHQFSVLNEKVDRLSEENKKLQELVHRYMPKH